MNKPLATKVLAVAIPMLLIAVVLYGRSVVSPAPPPPPAPRAPDGMVLLRDLSSVPPGTQLYSQSGENIGTVSAVELSHDFGGQGGVQPGYLIENVKAPAPVWLPASIVSTTYYVKK